MCLIRTAKLEIEVLQGLDDATMHYAILSHHWTMEVNYKEMKILLSCEQAYNDGFKWLWVDACCMDKQSSSELSEALNLMFWWYKNTKWCYTYLHDSNGWLEWFLCGWTLQELIAPRDLQFFNKNWTPIRDKQSLAPLEEITQVLMPVLRDGLSSSCPSAAQDQAYSLMGLFDVNLPMLYGEGKKAFQCLQLEVICMSNDQTLFTSTHQNQGVYLEAKCLCPIYW
ncbi:hypothetical protein EDC04DRAFT_2867972 [Pisolithus marmoratus]|nr:hypothetical protein EDC04DRAFT_2867972 [Pisolithus marmoratus]